MSEGYEIAAIEKIDLNGLLNKEPDTVNRFLGALQTTGIFYLDFRNAPYAPKVLGHLKELYSSADDYFEQPAEVKERDVRQDIKPSQDIGFTKSVCDENFEISFDEFIKGTKPDFVLPPALATHAALYKNFIEACHQTSHTMLSIALESLPTIPPPLESQHLHSSTSDSGLKLIYEPAIHKVANVHENKHTDSGLLTVLFYEDLGLHVQDPRTGNWGFTEALEGCALVNVANTLQRLSEGKFHSPLHRVTQVKDGFLKRYFLSYYFRPAH